jgi:hypothetical protein
VIFRRPFFSAERGSRSSRSSPHATNACGFR